jgi:hypothetical protein
MAGALELSTVYRDERLGLYQALYTDGPATSAELAARTGTIERYIREWLEHHAASGLLEVDDPAAGRWLAGTACHPGTRRLSPAPAMSATRRSAVSRSSAPRAGCRRWPRRSAAAVHRLRCRGHRRAGRSSTGPCSSICSRNNDCRPLHVVRAGLPELRCVQLDQHRVGDAVLPGAERRLLA